MASNSFANDVRSHGLAGTVSSNLSAAGRAIMDGHNLQSVETKRQFYSNVGIDKNYATTSSNSNRRGNSQFNQSKVDMNILVEQSKQVNVHRNAPRKQGRLFELNLGQDVSQPYVTNLFCRMDPFLSVNNKGAHRSTSLPLTALPTS